MMLHNNLRNEHICLGRCQSFTCDAEAHRPLCPGSVASCMCTTTGKTSFTQWNFPNSNLCLPDNQILLGQYRGSCAVKGLHHCSSFLNAIYVGNGTNCSSSKLIIIGHSSLNGIDIECRDLTSSEAGTLIGNATLDIVSKFAFCLSPLNVDRVLIIQ